MLYKTSVQWGDQHFVHYSFTYKEAVSWMYKYPNKDVLAVVTRIFKPGALTVRYFR